MLCSLFRLFLLSCVVRVLFRVLFVFRVRGLTLFVRVFVSCSLCLLSDPFLFGFCFLFVCFQFRCLFVFCLHARAAENVICSAAANTENQQKTVQAFFVYTKGIAICIPIERATSKPVYGVWELAM